MAGVDLSVKAGQMTGDSGGRIPLLRRVAVSLLVAAAALLMLLAVVAVVLRSQLLDTDNYVATMAPLADDPAVQSAVADALTEAVLARVDVAGAAADLGAAIENPSERNPLVALTLRNLSSVLGTYTEELAADAAATLVHSDAFSRTWVIANRQAHRGVVTVLTGGEGGVVRTDSPGVVTISLDPMLAEIGDELDSRGFVLPDREFELGTEFVLFESPELAKAQRAVRLLDQGAIAVTLAAVGCAIGAVLLAGSGFRRRAVLAVGAGVLLAMGLLGVVLLVARMVYLDRVRMRDDVAAAVFGTIAHPFWVALWVTAAFGVLLVAVAYVAGPSVRAVRVRATARQVLARIRR
ncbi:hypothetical protein [Nocardia rhizosphaerae]|uniref:Uncharacterized protein n=1 Tax=Nocardia rhizosphaerae TaxID=1691571 RepID=A0ABV8L1R0_9NOCA